MKVGECITIADVRAIKGSDTMYEKIRGKTSYTSYNTAYK